jgi:uncharacterized phiE125 gp8 family phage protein
MGYIMITGPAWEPITLEQAKVHLKTDPTDTSEDLYISGLISTAREQAEWYTRRVLVDQTWELRQNIFDRAKIDLEKTPVRSITSIKYINLSGVEVSVDPSIYSLITGREPYAVQLGIYLIWPVPRGDQDGIKIRFQAGYAYTDPEDPTKIIDNIPASFKSAILLGIGHLYEHRESVVPGGSFHEMPMGFYDLLNPYRLFTL